MDYVKSIQRNVSGRIFLIYFVIDKAFASIYTNRVCAQMPFLRPFIGNCTEQYDFFRVSEVHLARQILRKER